MTIAEDTVVSVNYYLTASRDNGPEELVEETTKDQPFVFLYGFGGVLEDFEANLNGKSKGDAFDFHVPAEKGYGKYENDYVINVDRAAFEIDGKFDDVRVRVGNDLEMRDAEGNPLNGRVVDINDKHVRMDFNHPLAGLDLHFKGEVLDVRQATEEEISHGHVHGPGGHHHH